MVYEVLNIDILIWVNFSEIWLRSKKHFMLNLEFWLNAYTYKNLKV